MENNSILVGTLTWNVLEKSPEVLDTKIMRCHTKSVYLCIKHYTFNGSGLMNVLKKDDLFHVFSKNCTCVCVCVF